MTVPKNWLMLLAGLLWVLGGAMVMKTGIPLLSAAGERLLPALGLAAVIFLIFYLAIFSRLVKKHSERIRSDRRERMPFYLFFDLSSYIVMIFMMTLGILIRKLELVPDFYIAFFYSGLGSALFSCGLKFISRFFRKAVLN